MILDRIKNKVSRSLVKFIQQGKFENDFIPCLPEEMKDLAKYSFYKNLTAEEKRIGKIVESFRKEIALLGDSQKFSSYSSPHSGTQLKNEKGEIIPGQFKQSAASEHAATGTNIYGGTQLKRILESFNGGRVLELGTNTGLSGCYFLSSPNLTELVTIEGSPELCKIAEKNLSRISSNYRIINALFDDALRDLRNKNEKFDCAFVDGQHEKQATLHYGKELMPLIKPNGVLIFDDIYWSQDMNQAWKQLCMWPEFKTTFDLGGRGICVMAEGKSENKAHYDLCDYSGRPSIYRKNW